jgi:predicted secreted protein
MGWLSGILVYFLIWWVVLFAVLPWGVRVPENPEPGHAPSAPSNPHVGLKLIVTSAVAAAIWTGVWYALSVGWISFHPA